jgi:Holliday junction resolvase RusA-like endonuclease
MIIEFTIIGEPKALKRHRTYTHGKGGKPLPFARQVDPSKGDKADFLCLARQHAPTQPLDCPVSLTIDQYFKRPNGHFGKKQGKPYLKPTSPRWYTSKPDFDNCAKLIADALNGIFWRDDSVICCAVVRKWYVDDVETGDSRPRTEIKIATLE